jgi:hypothetical protein
MQRSLLVKSTYACIHVAVGRTGAWMPPLYGGRRVSISSGNDSKVKKFEDYSTFSYSKRN